MRISDVARYALALCAGAMLAGCGGGSGTPLSPPVAGLTAEQTRVRSAHSVLHSFGGPGDGVYPRAGLLNVNHTLYGTTYSGGAKGTGTVYAITTSGAETVLHSFPSGSGDGVFPEAGLINVRGTLYGTTYSGGANGDGTVYAITPSGTETVLHSFGSKGERDGIYPFAGLLNVKGTLYGTTRDGGAHEKGTVFKITTSGREAVLYSFGSVRGDGETPVAGLINVDGTLYGTTEFGGTHCVSRVGCGTVFKITTSGKEAVLHSFGGSGDGILPYAGLLNVNGTLYGTTCCGGVNGDGTVFSITTSGKETVFYSFKGGKTDGEEPKAGLVSINGALYGTTYDGGSGHRNGGGGMGDGTVFSITTSGAEAVLYNFKGRPGSEHPLGGLIDVNGALYGTTVQGGAICGPPGCGTVYSLSP